MGQIVLSMIAGPLLADPVMAQRACSESHPKLDIMDAAAAAGLIETLKSAGPFTVFALPPIMQSVFAF